MDDHTLQQVIDLAIKTAIFKAKKGSNSGMSSDWFIFRNGNRG